ncbi:TPA: phage tail protein [Vibrio parahaemolyticus]
MANSTDKSILTAAGKALLAQLNAEEKALVIDKMIFANVPNRPEYPQPDDVVPTDHIVHQEQVEQRGRLSADSVIYSTTLTSDVGPFDFNWTGTYCSEYGVLVTIEHHALTPKVPAEPGVAGNTLVRSVVLEYKDVAEITNITVDASSWQYNATERMKKMDSDVAQSIIDQNGKDWFIEDGFLVTPSGSAYSIKAGAGYVSGNRVAMEFDRSVQVPNKPSFIYIDAHREGTATGEQVTLFNFVVTAEEKDDYIDSTTGKDVKHFVCKIGQVHADGSVSDVRPMKELDSVFKGEANRNKLSEAPKEKLLSLILRRNLKYLIEYHDWSHKLPINIFFKGGKYFTDFNILSLKPKRDVVIFVDCIDGDDNNNGLSIDSPLKNLSVALKKQGNLEIRLIRGGKYYYKNGWKGVDPARGISVICTQGIANLSNEAMPRTWEKDAENEGIWNTTSVANGENLHELEAEKSIRFIAKTREASSGSTEGYQLPIIGINEMKAGKVGVTVGVDNTAIRLPNNENPNDNALFGILYAKENVVIHCNDGNDEIVYLEGIQANYSLNLAPIDISTSSDNSLVLLNRCISTNSRANNGFSILANGLVVNYRCIATGCYKDGFNYHVNSPVSNSNELSVVEIECNSRNNGYEPNGLSHNGSTFHSTIKGIRLNCDHSYNRNRNVHDVGGLCQSFNVGLKAFGSWSDMAGIQAGVDDGSDMIKMWLVGCETDRLVIGAGGDKHQVYMSDDTVASSVVNLGGEISEYYP